MRKEVEGEGGGRGRKGRRRRRGREGEREEGKRRRKGGGEEEEKERRRRGERKEEEEEKGVHEWQEADGAATKLTAVTSKRQHCTWHARKSAVHFNLHKPRQGTKSSRVILCFLGKNTVNPQNLPPKTIMGTPYFPSS